MLIVFLSFFACGETIDLDTFCCYDEEIEYMVCVCGLVYEIDLRHHFMIVLEM